MNIFVPIIIICWLIFFGYWRYSAKSVKSTQETKIDFSQNKLWLYGSRFTIAFLSIECFRLIPIFPFTTVLFSQTKTLLIIGAAITVIGLLIAIWARKLLADNWSSNVEIKKQHQLITSGVYKFIRHPIYSGLLLMAFGTFLASATISSLLLFLILFFFMIYKLTNEEKLLLEHFPTEYFQYKKHTKALIPFIY